MHSAQVQNLSLPLCMFFQKAKCWASTNYLSCAHRFAVKHVGATIISRSLHVALNHSIRGKKSAINKRDEISWPYNFSYTSCVNNQQLLSIMHRPHALDTSSWIILSSASHAHYSSSGRGLSNPRRLIELGNWLGLGLLASTRYVFGVLSTIRRIRSGRM